MYSVTKHTNSLLDSCLKSAQVFLRGKDLYIKKAIVYPHALDSHQESHSNSFKDQTNETL